MVRRLSEGDTMVSATQQTYRIRRRKKTRAGKKNKKERAKTPTFPVHPEE